jgi:hypothetical protein
MRLSLYIILFFLTSTASLCKKTAENVYQCFSKDQAQGEINNKQAIIGMSAGKFYIYEVGSIDTRLVPCNLDKDFQVVGLQVTISGYTRQIPQYTCCTENLVITKISR